MGKQPTPQGISALLRKAGFDKSVQTASRIRGMKESSPGYQVSRGGKPGTVMVEFRQSSFRVASADELAAKTLARYREAIEAAGFTVEAGKSTFRNILIISAAPDLDAEEATPNG